jgi:hypothetical protein
MTHATSLTHISSNLAGVDEPNDIAEGSIGVKGTMARLAMIGDIGATCAMSKYKEMFVKRDKHLRTC